MDQPVQDQAEDVCVAGSRGAVDLPVTATLLKVLLRQVKHRLGARRSARDVPDPAPVCIQRGQPSDEPHQGDAMHAQQTHRLAGSNSLRHTGSSHRLINQPVGISHWLVSYEACVSRATCQPPSRERSEQNRMLRSMSGHPCCSRHHPCARVPVRASAPASMRPACSPVPIQDLHRGTVAVHTKLA